MNSSQGAHRRPWRNGALRHVFSRSQTRASSRVAAMPPPLRKGWPRGSVRRKTFGECHRCSSRANSPSPVFCRSRPPGGISCAQLPPTLHLLFRATRPPHVASNDEFAEKPHRCSSRAPDVAPRLPPFVRGGQGGLHDARWCTANPIDAHPRANSVRCVPFAQVM
jgi:hypothetical protein